MSEVEKLLKNIDTDKMRALSYWIDARFPDDSDPQVQCDLRKWASSLDKALALLRKPKCPTCGDSKIKPRRYDMCDPDDEPCPDCSKPKCPTCGDGKRDVHNIVGDIIDCPDCNEPEQHAKKIIDNWPKWKQSIGDSPTINTDGKPEPIPQGWEKEMADNLEKYGKVYDPAELLSKKQFKKLQKAAKKAARTGNKEDLEAYLILRRQYDWKE